MSQSPAAPAATSIPSTCCTEEQHELGAKAYSGPWVNGTSLIQPLLKTVRTSGLMDVGQSIPSTFTWRGKPYIHDGIGYNQGQCGGCWAFALTTSLADRYSIKYKKGLLDLSVLSILSCLGLDKQEGCSGGNVTCAALSLQEGGDKNNQLMVACGNLPNVGALPASCWPNCYVGANLASISPACIAESGCCDGSNQNTKFYIQQGSVGNVIMQDQNGNHDIHATITNIKRDIYNNGPIPVAVAIGSNLAQWWNSTFQYGGKKPEDVAPYIPTTPPPTNEGHAMVLMGWGSENGIDYWEVRNSWGSPGWFKFATSASTDQANWCGIDSAAYGSSAPGAASGGYISFLPGEWPSGSVVGPAPHEGGGGSGGSGGNGESGGGGGGGGNHKSKSWIWWIIGGVGGVALITLAIVLIIIFHSRTSKRRR